MVNLFFLHEFLVKEALDILTLYNEIKEMIYEYARISDSNRNSF